MGHYSMDVLAQQAGRQAPEHDAELAARAGVSFANLLPPVADSDSERPSQEQPAEAPPAEDSTTGADSKPGVSFFNMLPAAGRDHLGASLPAGSRSTEQRIPKAAGDVPAVSDNAVPDTPLEADGGGASDRGPATAAAAAEAAMLEGEASASSHPSELPVTVFTQRGTCQGQRRQSSSQTDQSHPAAGEGELVHSAHAPITLFMNVLPQPDEQRSVQEGSSGAAPDQATPGREPP